MFAALGIQHAVRMRLIVMWTVRLYKMFSKLSHKRHDFGNKLTEHKMCVLVSSTKFIRKISHFNENSAKYYHISTLVFAWRNRRSRQILIKLEFSRQSFEKSSNTRFNDKPSGDSRVVQRRWTNGETWQL